MQHLPRWPTTTAIKAGPHRHADPPMVPVRNRPVGWVGEEHEIPTRIAHESSMTTGCDQCLIVLKWLPRNSAVVTATGLATIALSRDGVTFDRAWVIRSEPTSLRFSGKHKIDGWQYPHALVWKDDLYVAYSINKEDLGITRIALRELLDDADPGGSE